MFLIGSLFPTFYLDRPWMGRRKTMMFGCFGLGVSMMMIAILLSIGTKNASSASVAFFFTYNLIFGGVRRVQIVFVMVFGC
jgi:hypothetical protein